MTAAQPLCLSASSHNFGKTRAPHPLTGLPVCLPVCLFVCLSVCLPILCVSVGLFGWLSPACLSAYLPAPSCAPTPPVPPPPCPPHPPAPPPPSCPPHPILAPHPPSCSPHLPICLLICP